MRKFNYALLATLLMAIFSSCEEDVINSSDVSTLPGTLNVEFVNKVDNQDLDITGNTNYINSLGEEYSVNIFKYYISNIRLIK